MAYRLIDASERDLWDKTAAQYSQILQSYEWGEIKSFFGWGVVRILLDDGGVVNILKRKLPFVKKCFFYVPRGPLIDFKNPLQLKNFISAVKAEAKKHKAVFLRMDPEIAENDNEALEILKKNGFIKAKKEIQPRSTYILDLSKNLDSIIADFESKFRYNIRLAEKKEIVVKQEDSEKAVDAFYGIYKETCSRQTFIIHPISYYKKILSLIIQKGMGSIFLAYYKDVPVAGVFVFIFGKRAWYMYGASSNEYRSLMPNNLIHWNVIKWAKEKGLKEYDLWGIPSNPDEKHPLWGVYRFKKGFNATLVKFIGSYDLPFNGLLYRLLDRGIILYQNLVRLIKKGKIEDSLGE